MKIFASLCGKPQSLLLHTWPSRALIGIPRVPVYTTVVSMDVMGVENKLQPKGGSIKQPSNATASNRQYEL